jgi:hypothetical protein
VTHEIILRIAARIEETHPQEAIKLRFCASDVAWLERRVNELVDEERTACRELRIVKLQGSK